MTFGGQVNERHNIAKPECVTAHINTNCNSALRTLTI